MKRNEDNFIPWIHPLPILLLIANLRSILFIGNDDLTLLQLMPVYVLSFGRALFLEEVIAIMQFF